MFMWLFPLLVAALPVPAGAIVTRHDVDDAQYRIAAKVFPALVDLPSEGHGTLIAPRWVVTVAHAVPAGAPFRQVMLNGKPREVERVIVHAGYKVPPKALIDQAMATGEAVLILTLLAASDDIALIKLKEPVTDVDPVGFFGGQDEFGRVIRIVGKGATGVGTKGHDPAGPNRTALRHGFNKVTSAHERWFCYQFDQVPAALPLEAIGGNGDSGGPVLTESGGRWLLAGMASWKLLDGDVRTARPGRYGQISCNVRLAYYRGWIESQMASDAAGS